MSSCPDDARTVCLSAAASDTDYVRSAAEGCARRAGLGVAFCIGPGGGALSIQIDPAVVETPDGAKLQELGKRIGDSINQLAAEVLGHTAEKS